MALWLLERRLRGDAERAVRVLDCARDSRVETAARAVLEQLWVRGDESRAEVWRHVQEAAWPPSAERRGGLTYPIVRFLLAPAPHAKHRPAVRVVAELRADRHYQYFCGATLVGSAVAAADARSRNAVHDLMATTDHPMLLDAIEDAFVYALRPSEALWDAGGVPTPLLRLALANPHLTRPPRRHYGLFDSPINELAVLAILRGRPDQLTRFEPYTLSRLLSLYAYATPDLPSPLRDACRRTLRELPPGPLREHLCSEAMEGTPGARAAVIGAGHLPADPARTALFLFCTHQWKKLEAHDPDRRKLLDNRPAYSERDWTRLEMAAHDSGRRCPPRLPPPKLAGGPSRPADRGGHGISGSGRYTDPGSGFSGGFGI